MNGEIFKNKINFFSQFLRDISLILQLSTYSKIFMQGFLQISHATINSNGVK